MFLQADDPNDGSLLIYECGWMGCDYQYEDIQDLMIHVMENGGHLGGGKFFYQYLISLLNCLVYRGNTRLHNTRFKYTVKIPEFLVNRD